MITTFSGLTLATNTSTTITLNVRIVPKGTDDLSAVDAPALDVASSSSLSTLARELSATDARAEIRNALLDQQALNEKANALLSKLLGAGYLADKALHDAQVPDSDDPVRLARARQATDFINGNASNPFEELSREQLALITYDESDTFTVNERRAAWEAASAQEKAWRQKIVKQSVDEYNATGQVPDTLKESLEHYRALPAIERAQYPENYQVDLMRSIILGMGNEPKTPEHVQLSLWTVVQELFDEDAFASLNYPGNKASSEPQGTASASSSATEIGS